VANTLLTIDMITREALRLAHEKATFIRTINRQFDDSFGDAGAKIGDTLRIRYPSQYTRRTGSRVMDVQDGVQLSTALTVATQDGVDMRFNSRELTLDLDEFSQLHLEPAMATLISNIDSDCIQACTKSTYNYAGTAGTAVSSLTAPGQARTRLNQNLAPKDENRRIQFDSGTMQQIVSGTAAYFNPSNAISEQFREGLVARTAMADYYENERVWTMANTTSITLSTAKMNGYLSTNGQTSLNISLLTVSAVGVGMKFTLGNIFDVHPETKAQYGQLKQFTVVSTTNVSTFNFLPAVFLSGPRQNVAGIGTTTSTQSLTWLGSPNSSYTLGLMYHKDAFTFATAALPLMAQSEKCVRRTYDGLSIRVWQDSDIRNDELLTRIDILYGYAAIRPEWACAIVGSAN
jgi:hypothetical protein